MKIWKKILIVNLVVTLAIMSFFIYRALSYLHGKEVKVEYQKYQKTLALWLTYADEHLSTGSIGVVIVVLTNDVYAPRPQYKYDEDFDWLKYVEVYGETIDNSYILLANGSGSEIRQAVFCGYNGSIYDGNEFNVNINYENKTECPLILTNPRNGSDAQGRLIRYDIDVYAVGYYSKPIYTYYDVMRYDILIINIYYGLFYSAIAFILVWVIAFIVWIVAYNIIGFVKWLKR
jgi:hypothetical protein